MSTGDDDDRGDDEAGDPSDGGAASPPGGSPAAPALSPVPDPPPPEVAELADACIGFVERVTKIRLDYAPETLPLLDHYARSARPQVLDKDELLELIAAPIGAYLGEVARRMLRLNWFAPPGEYRRWRIELENAYLSMNPIGAAVEALLLQDAEGWGAHFRLRREDEPVAADALAFIGEVPVDEYYAPSNRIETLSIVADALIHRSNAEHGIVPRYTAADYGPVRAEAIGDALADGDGSDGPTG